MSPRSQATFDIATQAAADANTAFLDLDPASRSGGADPGQGQLGGLTLPPGVYRAAGGSFLITGSDLTLDAQGDTNAVWVFQTASTLTIGGPGGSAQRDSDQWRAGQERVLAGGQHGHN